MEDGQEERSAEGPVVLFDGVCNLCNGTVQFVLDHERGRTLRFAALQSEAAADLLARVGGAALVREASAGDATADPGSMILVEGGRALTRSTAALRMISYLRAPYRWLRVFLLVPRPLRDAVYGFIAKHRYGWFGRAEACRVPTPELRARFLA